LQLLVEGYNHERAVLDVCKDRRMQNVVIALDHGEVNVPDLGPIEGRVYYLIFELADGDVRVQMDISTACGTLWCLQALRDVTLGLHQVHKEAIAHQDVKPSNVLTYEKDFFKVADFGRSSRRGYVAPHDTMHGPGDKTYAPPELLYGYTAPDFAARRLGCDLYMLGNLAAFLFTGVNVTALMIGKLDRAHHHTQWGGTYHDALPYLQNAWSQSLAELQALIAEEVRPQLIAMVAELCNPDLSKRGHPRGLGSVNQYLLERYVSQLDLLMKRTAILERARIKSAA
jgi:serine/threonine protein kinase